MACAPFEEVVGGVVLVAACSGRRRRLTLAQARNLPAFLQANSCITPPVLNCSVQCHQDLRTSLRTVEVGHIVEVMPRRGIMQLLIDIRMMQRQVIEGWVHKGAWEVHAGLIG